MTIMDTALYDVTVIYLLNREIVGSNPTRNMDDVFVVLSPQEYLPPFCGG